MTPGSKVCSYYSNKFKDGTHVIYLQKMKNYETYNTWNFIT
jgi:hypothetical protein